MTPRSEDYLKYIYVLSKTQDVHASQLAEEMGISRATVSVALKGLESSGYIKLNRNKEIFLTEAGRKVGCDIHEKNKVFLKILTSLGVDEKIARCDACKMEHVVSPESFEAFKQIIEKQ